MFRIDKIVSVWNPINKARVGLFSKVIIVQIDVLFVSIYELVILSDRWLATSQIKLSYLGILAIVDKGGVVHE